MRGLAGWVATGRAALDEGALLPMLEALAGRGAAGTADLVGFVDRRAGRQAVLGATLCDRAARVSLALDGAIANASELRAELAKRGHAFARGTDAEVVLRAYQHWGKDAVKHLHGAFAFALWDTGKECLLLARDRFGEKPLYLLEKGGAVFFASEIKALLAAPGVAPEVDLNAVWEFLAYRYVPGPRTLFSGIRKLAPATCLQWQFGRVQEIRYWIAPDRNPPAARTRQASQEDSVETFIASLDEAIRHRCGSAEGGAVLLSGGLDSAALVALASRAGAGVKTFALGFEGDPASELPRAAAVAKHFGTVHQEIVVKPAELLPGLGKLVAGRDAPSSRPSDLAVYRLAAEASRGAKIVLSGDGCDEILGGYRRHVAERFAWSFRGVPSMLGMLAPLARSANSRSALASLRLPAWRERYVRWNGALTEAERRRLSVLDLQAPERGATPPFDADPRASSLRRALYFDQMSSLPEQLLERNDRAAAAAGIELGMPFLDHRLAEYVSALPDDRRVRGLATKWILRQAGKRLIPEVLASRKAGFRLPVRDWLRNELRDTLLDHLQSSASRTRQYYETRLLDRMLDEHLKGRNNHETPLWTLLNLEIWHRQYKPT
jgi:asparagine synthase (glutamine-hydrolysing)